MYLKSCMHDSLDTCSVPAVLWTWYNYHSYKSCFPALPGLLWMGYNVSTKMSYLGLWQLNSHLCIRMLLTLLFTELVNRYPRAHPFNLAINSGHFYSEESSSTKTGQGTWNVWLIGVVETSVDIASGMNWVLKIQIMHRCTGIISGTSKSLLSMAFTEDVLQLVHVELEIIRVLLMLAILALKCKHWWAGKWDEDWT